MANLQNMAKWVLALIDGDYEQGQGYLNRDGKFCCLGVACEAAIADGVEIERGTAGQTFTYATYDGGGFLLPDRVMEWLGITGQQSSNPEIAGQLASWWNDHAETNFNGIAHLISREYGLPEYRGDIRVMAAGA